MSKLRELAYAIDPALWVQHVLEVEPAPWQAQFLRAPRGASIIALTARQVGKTTAAAWGITHYMLFTPGGLSVIACPAQRQSAEAVRRVGEGLSQFRGRLEDAQPDWVQLPQALRGPGVAASACRVPAVTGRARSGWPRPRA